MRVHGFTAFSHLSVTLGLVVVSVTAITSGLAIGFPEAPTLAGLAGTSTATDRSAVTAGSAGSAVSARIGLDDPTVSADRSLPPGTAIA